MEPPQLMEVQSARWSLALYTLGIARAEAVHCLPQQTCCAKGVAVGFCIPIAVVKDLVNFTSLTCLCVA